MARPIPTTTAALAVLAGTHEPDGSPLTLRTRRRVAAAVDAARTEILAAVAEHGAEAAAVRLGVAPSTLRLWRAAGGWLHTEREGE